MLTDLGSVKFATKAESTVVKDSLAEAIEDVADIECKKEKEEEEKPVEIHTVSQEIIDEQTGKRIGVRTTRTIKSTDQTPGEGIKS
jgi:hypothetical protein